MGEEEEESDVDEPEQPKKRVQHNQVSRDCILYSKKEGNRVSSHLKKLNRVHIPVSKTTHPCYFDAILCQVNTPPLYTSYHMRLQMCMYMIEHYQDCIDILQYRLVGYNTSLYLFIKKFIDFYEWGEETLTPIICKMWGISISVLNIFNTDPFNNYNCDTVSKDVIIIYNGSSHYTGTGKNNCFALFF